MGRDKASGENALIIFTDNFKRVLDIIGVELFKKLLIVIENGNIKQIKQDIEQHILLYSLFFSYFLEIVFLGRFIREKLGY